MLDKEKSNAYMRLYKKNNRPKFNKMNREARDRRRLKILKHYGGKCACCGEIEPKFLAIDHINGGGNEHRAKALGVKGGRGGDITPWIIRNNFPQEFQLLCHNCNFGKYINKGTCPHKNKIND